jgi:uncharacterized protein (DUF1501 family)
MSERALVVLFLRGGADGLALVPPVGDDDYHRARPGMALDARDVLPLDGFFGIHPALEPLRRYYDAGQLAIVHACGSSDETRSHFHAQDLMERAGVSVSGGWLGRWLRAQATLAGEGAESSPLEALSVGTALAESMRGAPTAAVMRSLADLGGSAAEERLRDPLKRLYARDALLAAPARSALEAGARLRELERADPPPQHGAIYPDRASHGQPAEELGRSLRLVARCLQGGVGLRAACVDLPGWDSHIAQATWIAPQMRALGAALAAFATDLGPRLDTTSVVVLSEFGRRVAQNASLGTDHGRGGALFVLGGGTPGGVHCAWPGLATEALEGPGDLPVVHDYRDALAAVLARHGAGALDEVFPGHPIAPLPV